MPQYEITSAPLLEAANEFNSLADNLITLEEKLSSALSSLSDPLSDFQQQIARECNAIEELSLYAQKLGKALLEIIEVYARVEQTAFSDDAYAEKRQTTPLTLSPPIVRKTYGMILSGELILPDWLQAAIFRYEQLGP